MHPVNKNHIIKIYICSVVKQIFNFETSCFNFNNKICSKTELSYILNIFDLNLIEKFFGIDLKFIII